MKAQTQTSLFRGLRGLALLALVLLSGVPDPGCGGGGDPGPPPVVGGPGPVAPIPPGGPVPPLPPLPGGGGGGGGPGPIVAGPPVGGGGGGGPAGPAPVPPNPPVNPVPPVPGGGGGPGGGAGGGGGGNPNPPVGGGNPNPPVGGGGNPNPPVGGGGGAGGFPVGPGNVQPISPILGWPGVPGGGFAVTIDAGSLVDSLLKKAYVILKNAQTGPNAGSEYNEALIVQLDALIVQLKGVNGAGLSSDDFLRVCFSIDFSLDQIQAQLSGEIIVAVVGDNVIAGNTNLPPTNTGWFATFLSGTSSNTSGGSRSGNVNDGNRTNSNGN
jgi:hypothetical protein